MKAVSKVRALAMGAAAAIALSLVAAAPAAGGAGDGGMGGSDALSRVLPENSQIGGLKADKQVAMFYFLLHGDLKAKPGNPVVSEIVAANPGVLSDQNDPAWGSPINSLDAYYWGQPLWGFYHAQDYWVHLRNVQLLTDAGVDILVVDVSNGPTNTYPQAAETLMSAIAAVEAQGKTPPKVAFYTNSSSGDTMQTVYNNFFKAGAPYDNHNAFYNLDGKPLIIGRAAEAIGRDYQNFFTYRESQWPNEGARTNGWPWMEFQRPQRVYTNTLGRREIVNVSLAQHPTGIISDTALYGIPGNWGRSYRNGAPGTAADLPYGYNAQEQWDYAIAQNTPFIFVTGWNEWVAFRLSYSNGRSNFVDTVTPEYSRDIEPTLSGGLKDSYYMQLVENIRRYKGVPPAPDAGSPETISSVSDWDRVSTTYTDYVGDTADRNHVGARDDLNYTNTTGRNDIHVAKVSRDADRLYFTATTSAPLTSNSSSNWMRLYIDMDRTRATGWEGYEYRVAGGQLQQFVSGAWQNAGPVTTLTSANRVSFGILRSALGGVSDPINLEFKWSDNMQADDAMDWYVNGDAAPGGRLNYVYSTVQPASVPVIADAGFESPAISGFSYNPVGAAWNFSNTHAGLARNGSAFGAPTAPQGSQVGFVQRQGSITQSVNFNSTGEFQLSFAAASRDGASPQTVEAWIDSTLVGTFTPGSAFTANVTEPFSVTAGAHTVKFVGTSTEDRTAFLDKVKLAPRPVAPDGGFESPAVTGFQYAPSGSWTFSWAYAGLSRAGGGFGVPTPPDGSQVAFVQRTGYVTRQVSFASSGTYTVRFAAANRSGYAAQRIRVLIDGIPAGEVDVTSSSFQSYESQPFSLASGNHSVTFAGLSVDDRTAFIDSIRIQAR